MLSNFFCIKREDVQRMGSNMKLLAVYVMFVSRARWNGSWFSPTGKPLKVGQFFFGNQELADSLGCNIKTVRSLVRSLDRSGYITLDNTNKFGSIGSICNLELISTLKTQSEQSRAQERTDHWTDDGTDDWTLKNNVNKENNVTPIIPKGMSSFLTISQIWNKKIDAAIPKVVGSNSTRDTRCKVLLDKYPDPKFWEDFVEKINASKFLCGEVPPKEGNRPFIASFDWCLKPSNFQKVIEGNYGSDRMRVVKMAVFK